MLGDPGMAAEKFQRAMDCHRAGRIEEAERLIALAEGLAEAGLTDEAVDRIALVGLARGDSGEAHRRLAGGGGQAHREQPHESGNGEGHARVGE
jgi:hypothetical protein